MAKSTKEPRTLTQDVIVHGPGSQGTHTFVAGTAEADVPAWARDEIRNPAVWSDAVEADTRLDGILFPRMLAFGAPPRMVDEFREALDELSASERTEAITKTLQATIDDAKTREMIGTWRTQREEHSGEVYDDYVDRAIAAGATAIPFDAWVEVADFGLVPVAAPADGEGTSETGTQGGSGDPGAGS